MSVSVQNLATGQVILIPFEASRTVDELRVLAQRALGINPRGHIRLISPSGKGTMSGLCADYGISPGSMVFLNHESEAESTSRLTVDSLSPAGAASEAQIQEAHPTRMETRRAIMPVRGAPVRRWFFLGGSQCRPISHDQWEEYSPDVAYHLNSAFDEMLLDGRTDGLLLDLAPFTNPPAPYQVWKGIPEMVKNPREMDPLLACCGGRMVQKVAGFDSSLWDMNADELPPVARQASLVKHFYQVH